MKLVACKDLHGRVDAQVAIDEHDVLGRGSFGVVVRGKMADRSVAVKLPMPSSKTGGCEVIKLCKCRHANVCEILAVFRCDGRDAFGIVMEMLGPSLFETIKQRPDEKLPEEDAAPLLRGVARALAFVHYQGVVHCDVKLENILVCDGGKRSKLIDFGMDGSGGSLPYLAPELLVERQRMAHTHWCRDAWAFGVVIFCSVAGFAPFAQANARKDECFRHCLDLKQRELAALRAPRESGERETGDDTGDRGLCARIHTFYARECALSDEVRSAIDAQMAIDPRERASAASLVDHSWFGQALE